MPTLTAVQLNSLFDMNVGATGVYLWIPAGYGGAFTAAIERGIVDAPCYGLALFGGPTGNVGIWNNPEALYVNLAPINPYNQVARLAPVINLPAGQHIDDMAALTASWNAARAPASTDVQRMDFMLRMMTNVARFHGFVISVAPTNYKLSMTVPRDEWYSWQHWAIGIGTAAANFRYLQTDTTTNVSPHWGCSRVWETERPGHLLVEVYLTEILQQHVDLIDRFLAMPKCTRCRAIKPETTVGVTRWHQCTAGHNLCHRCSPPAPRSTRGNPYARAAICRLAICRQAIAPIADNARPR